MGKAYSFKMYSTFQVHNYIHNTLKKITSLTNILLKEFFKIALLKSILAQLRNIEICTINKSVLNETKNLDCDFILRLKESSFPRNAYHIIG